MTKDADNIRQCREAAQLFCNFSALAKVVSILGHAGPLPPAANHRLHKSRPSIDGRVRKRTFPPESHKSMMIEMLSHQREALQLTGLRVTTLETISPCTCRRFRLPRERDTFIAFHSSAISQVRQRRSSHRDPEA